MPWPSGQGTDVSLTVAVSTVVNLSVGIHAAVGFTVMNPLVLAHSVLAHSVLVHSVAFHSVLVR